MTFNFENLEGLREKWHNAKPFHHVIIDDFLPIDVAEAVAAEFPDADSDFWYEYSNPLEIKKACSDWNRFTPAIYKTLSSLLQPETTNNLSFLVGKQLYADYGLHGGGLHCHKAGGKLNTHLDYNIHPKADLQRKVNIILYVAKDWDPKWNGSLGLWDSDENGQPKNLVQSIECKFNRALIFDTTMNSWHGLPEPVTCPINRSRNSLATYYLCDPPEVVDQRGKALYAPTDDQKDNPEILDLIKKRANLSSFSQVYKVKE
jgi:Rps23 Pro-64 3,4-dihydroxylase Tpa1-like proline 4-hydroxylase